MSRDDTVYYDPYRSEITADPYGDGKIKQNWRNHRRLRITLLLLWLGTST
jgi:hypothetical protein